MKSLGRAFLFLVVVALLAVGAPQSAPQLGGPLPVAAAGWYNRTATWWMDDSKDNNPGGQVYRVKMSLAWQTRDYHGTCYVSTPAAPDGTGQAAYTNVPKCAKYDDLFRLVPANHFFPSQNLQVQCWVSNAFLLTVGIDYCGPITSQQNYPPYYFVYGARFHVCIGIYGTPFSYCDYFTSRVTVLGSSLWIWNSGS